MSSSEPKKPKILVDHVQGDPEQLPEGFICVRSRSADAPARISRQAEVIDDAGQIATCRSLYEQELDRLFASALTAVEQGNWLHLEQEGAFSARRAQAVCELRRIISGQKEVSPAGRARAASALLALHET